MATHIKIGFKRVLQTAAFWGAFFIFALLGSLASVACAVAAVWFRGPRAHVFGQRLIQKLFRIFLRYCCACGLVEVDLGALSALRGSRGLIVVANHPGLLDAVLVVAQLPQAVCLMKRSLERNLIYAGTARLAGYVHNQSGLGLVKQCEARLKEGANLLVFPEGTRTVDGKLLPFKMGFALVAVLSRMPVQTIFITSESGCLGKGWPFLKIPSFPMRYGLRLGRRFQPEPGVGARQFGRAVESYFQETLSQSGHQP